MTESLNLFFPFISFDFQIISDFLMETKAADEKTSGYGGALERRLNFENSGEYDNSY